MLEREKCLKLKKNLKNHAESCQRAHAPHATMGAAKRTK